MASEAERLDALLDNLKEYIQAPDDASISAADFRAQLMPHLAGLRDPLTKAPPLSDADRTAYAAELKKKKDGGAGASSRMTASGMNLGLATMERGFSGFGASSSAAGSAAAAAAGLEDTTVTEIFKLGQVLKLNERAAADLYFTAREDLGEASHLLRRGALLYYENVQKQLEAVELMVAALLHPGTSFTKFRVILSELAGMLRGGLATNLMKGIRTMSDEDCTRYFDTPEYWSVWQEAVATRQRAAEVLFVVIAAVMPTVQEIEALLQVIKWAQLQLSASAEQYESNPMFGLLATLLCVLCSAIGIAEHPQGKYSRTGADATDDAMLTTQTARLVSEVWQDTGKRDNLQRLLEGSDWKLKGVHGICRVAVGLFLMLIVAHEDDPSARRAIVPHSSRSHGGHAVTTAKDVALPYLIEGLNDGAVKYMNRVLASSPIRNGRRASFCLLMVDGFVSGIIRSTWTDALHARNRMLEAQHSAAPIKKSSRSKAHPRTTESDYLEDIIMLITQLCSVNPSLADKFWTGSHVDILSAFVPAASQQLQQSCAFFELFLSMLAAMCLSDNPVVAERMLDFLCPNDSTPDERKPPKPMFLEVILSSFAQLAPATTAATTEATFRAPSEEESAVYESFLRLLALLLPKAMIPRQWSCSGFSCVVGSASSSRMIGEVLLSVLIAPVHVRLKGGVFKAIQSMLTPETAEAIADAMLSKKLLPETHSTSATQRPPPSIVDEFHGPEAALQSYPCTRGFLSLCNAILPHCPNAPFFVQGNGMPRFLRFVVFDVFLEFHTKRSDVAGEQWQLAVLCLEIMAKLVRAYDPKELVALQGTPDAQLSLSLVLLTQILRGDRVFQQLIERVVLADSGAHGLERQAAVSRGQRTLDSVYKAALAAPADEHTAANTSHSALHKIVQVVTGTTVSVTAVREQAVLLALQILDECYNFEAAFFEAVQRSTHDSAVQRLGELLVGAEGLVPALLSYMGYERNCSVGLSAARLMYRLCLDPMTSLVVDGASVMSQLQYMDEDLLKLALQGIAGRLRDDGDVELGPEQMVDDQAEPVVRQRLRAVILELLINCLSQRDNGVDVISLIILSLHQSDRTRARSSGAAQSIVVLKQVLNLVRHAEFMRRAPHTAEACYQLVFILCNHPSTSGVMLRILQAYQLSTHQSDERYFLFHLSQVLKEMVPVDAVDSVIVAHRRIRSWLLRGVALDLFWMSREVAPDRVAIRRALTSIFVPTLSATSTSNDPAIVQVIKQQQLIDRELPTAPRELLDIAEAAVVEISVGGVNFHKYDLGRLTDILLARFPPKPAPTPATNGTSTSTALVPAGRGPAASAPLVKDPRVDRMLAWAMEYNPYADKLAASLQVLQACNQVLGVVFASENCCTVLFQSISPPPDSQVLLVSLFNCVLEKISGYTDMLAPISEELGVSIAVLGRLLRRLGPQVPLSAVQVRDFVRALGTQIIRHAGAVVHGANSGSTPRARAHLYVALLHVLKHVTLLEAPGCTDLTPLTKGTGVAAGAWAALAAIGEPLVEILARDAVCASPTWQCTALTALAELMQVDQHGRWLRRLHEQGHMKNLLSLMLHCDDMEEQARRGGPPDGVIVGHVNKKLPEVHRMPSTQLEAEDNHALSVDVRQIQTVTHSLSALLVQLASTPAGVKYLEDWELVDKCLNRLKWIYRSASASLTAANVAQTCVAIEERVAPIFRLLILLATHAMDARVADRVSLFASTLADLIAQLLVWVGPGHRPSLAGLRLATSALHLLNACELKSTTKLCSWSAASSIEMIDRCVTDILSKFYSLPWASDILVGRGTAWWTEITPFTEQEQADADTVLPQGSLFDTAFSVQAVTCGVSLLYQAVTYCRLRMESAATAPADATALRRRPVDRCEQHLLSCAQQALASISVLDLLPVDAAQKQAILKRLEYVLEVSLLVLSNARARSVRGRTLLDMEQQIVRRGGFALTMLQRCLAVHT